MSRAVSARAMGTHQRARIHHAGRGARKSNRRSILGSQTSHLSLITASHRHSVRGPKPRCAAPSMIVRLFTLRRTYGFMLEDETLPHASSTRPSVLGYCVCVYVVCRGAGPFRSDLRSCLGGRVAGSRRAAALSSQRPAARLRR